MVNSLAYYDENAKAFIDNTRNLGFTKLQDKFLE